MHSPLEQFDIKPLLPLEIGGYNVSFTNSSLLMCIAAGLAFLLLFLGARKIQPHPSRLQAFSEILYNLIDDLVVDVSGKDAKKFVPLIFSLFLFILICNLLGMIPFSFTVTSHIAVTFALAIVLFIGITMVGFARHGWHYLSLFLPHGTPAVMAPLMVAIELMSYLIRPVSLSLRLAANMTAGHVAMKVIAYLALTGGFLFGAFPFAFLCVFTGFEIFIAVLQAYIFSILTCVYLRDAVQLH
jgi:F-type H+-transporting ATPase subunit a